MAKRGPNRARVEAACLRSREGNRSPDLAPAAGRFGRAPAKQRTLTPTNETRSGCPLGGYAAYGFSVGLRSNLVGRAVMG